MRLFATLGLFGLLAVVLAGCAAPPPPPTQQEIQMLLTSPEVEMTGRPSDVPVPDSFQQVSHSAGRKVGRIRAFNGAYKGERSLYAVLNFYADRMPRHGWTENGQSHSEGSEAVRNYVKVRDGVKEVCRIAVKESEFRVFLNVSLAPDENQHVIH